MAAPACALAQSPLLVEGAWVRAGASQTGTAAYMRLTAREPLTLVGVATPAAGVAEVHEMKLEGDIMRMRALTHLDLPAGRAIELRPGGLHLMLMDLKAPPRAGTRMPLTLLVRDAKGAQRRIALELPVTATAPGPAGGARVEPAAPARH